jgi:hypothetical protein
MSENTTNGNCLCKKVTIKVDSIDKNMGACHCSMCLKWGGGPLLALDCKDRVEFTGVEYIKCYRSSEWAERGFCVECGTHLFYRLIDNNQHIMPAALFDDLDKVIFDHQIFIDEKPNYYDFANQTKTMTGKEVFEQFGA